MLLLQLDLPRNPVSLLSPTQQRRDAEVLREAVEELHPDLERWAGRRGVEGARKVLFHEATLVGDATTWYRAISTYLARFRSAQLQAEWPEPVAAELRSPGSLEGVTALEGFRVSNLRRAFGPWTSVEGHTDYAKDPQFEENLPRFLPILKRLKSSFNLLVDGEAREVPGVVPSPEPALNWKNPVGSDAILTLRRLDFDPSRLEEVLKELSQETAPRLILDLRECRGDDVAGAGDLLSALCPTPPPLATRVTARSLQMPTGLVGRATWDEAFFNAERFEKVDEGYLLRPDAMGAFGAPPPKEDAFGGKLDVLIGPGTGAAAAYLVGRLASARPVRTIGAPAGGYTAGYAGGRRLEVTLPASRIRVKIPLLRIESGDESRVPLGPEVAVPGNALRWAIEHPPTGP
jgi:hypothetical protein